MLGTVTLGKIVKLVFFQNSDDHLTNRTLKCPVFLLHYSHMFDLNQTLPVIAITVLTVLLSIISIQIILILKDVRKTVSRANALMDGIDNTITKLTDPTRSIGGLISGVREGLRLFDSFSQMIGSRRSDNDPSRYEQL